MDLRDKGRLHEVVLTPAEGLSHLPRVEVEGDLVKAVRNGRRLSAEAGAGRDVDGPMRMMAGRRLLAIYRGEGDESVPEVVLS